MSTDMPPELHAKIFLDIKNLALIRDLNPYDLMAAVDIAYLLIRNHSIPDSINNKVCGLELQLVDDEKITTPLCALAVVKHLTEDGSPVYSARATDNLLSVEALGMARYAMLQLEKALQDDD